MVRWPAIIAILCALPGATAGAASTSYPMSQTDCFKAIADTAQQIGLPVAPGVDTADRREFQINTNSGPVVMICQRIPAGGAYDWVLTIQIPGETSLTPYVK